MEEPKQEKEELQASEFFDSLNDKILSFFMRVLFESGPIECGAEASKRERRANTFFFNLINEIEDGVKRALVSSAVREARFHRLLDPSEDWSNLVQWDEQGSVIAFSFPCFEWGFNEANPWEIECRFITLWTDLLSGDASGELLLEISLGSSRLCDYCDQFVTLEQIQSGNWSYGPDEDGPGLRGCHINHKH